MWWRAGLTFEWWTSLTAEQKFAVLETMSDEEVESFYRDWRVWGRDNQLRPGPGCNGVDDDAWTTWLRLCGRGEGKTRTGSEHIIEREKRGYGRMCLLGQGEDDVREVMIEGESGIIACAPKDRRPKYFPSVGQGRLEWPSGALCFVYSAADPEALRGPQFQYAWVDEPMAFNPEARTKALSNLRFGLRLKGPRGEPPQQMFTTTPKPHRWLKELVKRAESDPRIRITRGSTFDNVANLSAEAVEDMAAEYLGTSLGRQELYAELLTDEEGALFSDTMIDRSRILPPDLVLAFETGRMDDYELWIRRFARSCDKVVVGVDPNVTEGGKTAHAAGIVVVGKKNGHRYTLADRSTKGGPSKWGNAVIKAYEDFDADEIVVEVNQGGDLIKKVLQDEADFQDAGDVVIKKVRAWKGKQRRAEPVATAYERGVSHHIGPVGHKLKPGPLYALEQQLCALHDGFDPTGEDFDRADANNYAHQRLGRRRDDDSDDLGEGGGIFLFGQLGMAA